MDYSTYRRNRFRIHIRGVYQPDINLDHLHEHLLSHTSSAHVRVVFLRCTKYEIHEQSSHDDGTTTLVETFESPRKAATAALFDSSMLWDQSTLLYQALSGMLGRLHIDEVAHPAIASIVTRFGCSQIKDSVSNMGRKVLPLFAEIVVVWEYVRHERELIDMAIRESIVESERRLHGMVPARKSAIFKALKIERIDGGVLREEDDDDDDGECRRKRRRRIEHKSESCTICMEDLPAGAYVTRMPCSHRFHGQCIVKWLKTSHCCPVCRFEIPT